MRYGSQYIYQTFGLIGCIFVWILIPWLSVIEQSQHVQTLIQLDFRQIAPLNVFFALSASCCASFATSIFFHGKISVHDIVFSAFSVHINLFREVLLMEPAQTSSQIHSQLC